MKIRRVLEGVIIVMILSLNILSATAEERETTDVTEKTHLYIGTDTEGESSSRGIYYVEFDSKSENFSTPLLVAETESPALFTFTPDSKFLYTTNEISPAKIEREHTDLTTYGVTLFKANQNGEKMDNVEEVGSQGVSPCYISYNPRKRGDNILSIANYTSGNIINYLIDKEDYTLSSPKIYNLKESDKAISHAHSTQSTPDNKYLIITDLGQDNIYLQPIGKERVAPQKKLTLPKGSGPRHLLFHPNNSKLLYVINELGNTISLIHYSSKRGELELIKSYPTLPSERRGGESFTAHIAISPDGKYIYGSNRGDNSITTFKVESSGELTYASNISVYGNWPRNFTLTPNGSHLIVANRRSDNIVLFRRDSKSGALTKLDSEIKIDRPLYLLFRE